MSVEDPRLCPECREPRQGLVCQCGCDLREVDVVYCAECSKPATKEAADRQTWQGSSVAHASKSGYFCPNCQ